MGKRVKYAFSSFVDIVDLWATQSQDNARCRNGFYYGDRIYSYGHHYVAARLYTFNGVRVAFVNTKDYSQTTNGHLYSVRRALYRAGIPAFDAVDGVFPDGELDHAAVFEGLLALQGHLVDRIMYPFTNWNVWYSKYYRNDHLHEYEGDAQTFDQHCARLGIPELRIDLPGDFWELALSHACFESAEQTTRANLYRREQPTLPGNFRMRSMWDV